MKDGHLVSRQSDFIMYSVEAEFLDRVVAMYGPCECWTALRVSPRWSSADDGVPATKIGAIVSGQTSVKAPERAAFEKYLPDDVFIISIHSLHGPTVAPDGQALVRFFAFFFSCLSMLILSMVILDRNSAPRAGRQSRAGGTHPCPAQLALRPPQLRRARRRDGKYTGSYPRCISQVRTLFRTLAWNPR